MLSKLSSAALLLSVAFASVSPAKAESWPGDKRDFSRGALVCRAHAPLARTISNLADRGLKIETARRMIGFTADVDPRLEHALADTVTEIYKGNMLVSALAVSGGWAEACKNYFKAA